MGVRVSRSLRWLTRTYSRNNERCERRQQLRVRSPESCSHDDSVDDSINGPRSQLGTVAWALISAHHLLLSTSPNVDFVGKRGLLQAGLDRPFTCRQDESPSDTPTDDRLGWNGKEQAIMLRGEWLAHNAKVRRLKSTALKSP